MVHLKQYQEIRLLYGTHHITVLFHVTCAVTEKEEKALTIVLLTLKTADVEGWFFKNTQYFKNEMYKLVIQCDAAIALSEPAPEGKS